jgi:heme exporter protein A
VTDGVAAPVPRGSLSAAEVWRGFGRERVLRGVSLELTSGNSLAILGRNGSGKSTLLRVLAGLLRPARGRVLVGGEDLFAAPRARARLGYVGHEPMLYGGLTVMENLRLYAALYGLPDPRARTEEACALLDLEAYRDTLTARLSRGLTQRAAVARAVLHRPQVLLLDEPFAGLDPDATARLAAHLDAFRAAGGTLILATHHPAEAARLSDTARRLTGGRLTPPLPLAGLDPAAIEAWYRDGGAVAGRA